MQNLHSFRAALTGPVMPGPTRQQAPQHTWRYHFDHEELQAAITFEAMPPNVINV